MENQQTIKRGAVRAASVGSRLRRSLFVSIGVLVLTLLAASVLGAGTRRLLIPQDFALPFYVTGLGNTGFSPDDWVITAFYYPPADIPGDYDLFNQPVWDPPVGVDTPYVQGFIMFNAKNSDYPVQQVLKTAPGARVPIWFTRMGDWNDTWTVNEMQKQHLLKGWADFYSEVDEPGTASWHSTVVASGTLEDGRSFWVQSYVTRAWWDGHAQAWAVKAHWGP
jgi:hypothetical protein